MDAHKINTTFNKSNELILQEIFSKKTNKLTLYKLIDHNMQFS